jgi:hypothetical protein
MESLMHPTLVALLDVLTEIEDDVLRDCYDIDTNASGPSDPDLDVALMAWRRAGCPRPRKLAARSPAVPEMVLTPWEPDTDTNYAAGWVPGRVRRDPAGFEVAYTGTMNRQPAWGVRGLHRKSDTPGTEADADTYLRSKGYALAEQPAAGCAFPTPIPGDTCHTCDGAGCPVCRPEPTRQRTPAPAGCEACGGCPDCLEIVRETAVAGTVTGSVAIVRDERDPEAPPTERIRYEPTHRRCGRVVGPSEDSAAEVKRKADEEEYGRLCPRCYDYLEDVDAVERRFPVKVGAPLVGTLNATTVTVVQGDVGTIDMGKV